MKRFTSEIKKPKSILESIDSSVLDELIKTMGFENIHELKKNKNILMKLEALVKEMNSDKKEYEDRTDEIEDIAIDKGKPKSLESDTSEEQADIVSDEIDAEEELEEDNEIETTQQRHKTEKSRIVKTFGEFIAEEELREGINNFLEEDYEDQEEEYAEDLTESEVKSDEDFKEYAFTVLQNAFGDEFDETKAQEVVDGLTTKYSGDYGAMVGALKASLGK